MWGWLSAAAASASRVKRALTFRIVEKMRRKKLQRDGALQLGVLGLVNDTHPALTELLGNVVVR